MGFDLAKDFLPLGRYRMSLGPLRPFISRLDINLQRKPSRAGLRTFTNLVAERGKQREF